MKVKIDKDGFLWLERAGKMKKQHCPHDPCGDILCWDGCPLFREPLHHRDGQVSLALCQTAYIVDEKDFVDERGE